jgi:hypothetical protein
MARKVETTFNGAPDLFALYDSGSEFGADCERLEVSFSGGSWYGKEGPEESLRKLAVGDNALVPASEQLLASLEGLLPHTARYVNIMDVVGALPNVPAFIAGVPVNMRRRAKVARDDAPISVVCDVTSSSGISTDGLLKRGTALLAFVRLLSEHRQVSLWCGIGLNVRSGSSMVLWRIDTTPLDLARAAHLLSAPSVSRGLGYNLSHKLHSSDGGWPFNDHSKHCETGEARLRAVLDEQVHFVPPMFMSDELVSQPVKWLRRELAKYLPQDEEAT